LASGCGVFDFDIDQPVPEQNVQGSVFGAVFGTLVPSPFPLSINFAEETKARGTGPVKAAGLKTLTFNITATSMPSGDTDDFSFVQGVDIFIESTMSGTALQKQKIADLPTAPGAVQQLDLHTYPDVNLLPYINEGSRISSTATGNVPPDDVTFNGKITVHVNTF
jgi:hypothetical protein